MLTWLLVEDDTDIRNVVAVMISVWGEKPLAFADGNAVWAWLDSVANGTFAGELPDLALMDIRMPGYTGDKVAARIRKTLPIKDIPIILMTAFSLSDAEIKVMSDETGIDHLINKPLPDMADFRGIMYRVRDERRAKTASVAAPQPTAERVTPPPPSPGTAPASAGPAAPAPAVTSPSATVPAPPVPPIPPAPPQTAPASVQPATPQPQPQPTPPQPSRSDSK